VKFIGTLGGSAQAAGHFASPLPLDPFRRSHDATSLPRDLESFDNHGSPCTAITAVVPGLYQSFPGGCGDYPQHPLDLNDAVGYDAPYSHDPALINGLPESNAITGHAVPITTLDQDSASADLDPATLSQEYFYSHVIEECDTVGDSPGFDYGGATDITQDFNTNVMIMVETDAAAEVVSCIYDGCVKTFTRTADLYRHVLNVHNRIGHHCQVLGCSNNKGKGYCRSDKLKEHMWKKHKLVADLSYTKAKPSPFDLFQ
jgi:hypothetical protein